MEPRGHTEELLPEGEELPPPGTRNIAIARWALVGLMTVVAAAAWVHYFEAAPRTTQAVVQYRCPMHPSVITDIPGACPICGMDLAPIQLGGATTGKPTAPTSNVTPTATSTATDSGSFWCPMHPEVISDAPNATCAKCGMKLVPRPKGAGAKARAGVPGLVPIDLTPERIQLIGMRTAQVTRETLSPGLRTVGVITAAEGAIAVVTARFSGWIEKLLVAQSGRYVNKGQALARIYSPDLLGPQQAYLNALRWLHDKEGAEPSRALELDARARLQLAGVSNEDIDEINRTRKPLRALSVRAPMSGYVGKKTAVTGLYVEPGTELFEIADLSTVWVVADVYESEIELVKAGQKATVAVPAIPGQTFTDRVSFLYPVVSPGSRTLKIRLELRNPGLRLLPGMFANVTLDLDAVEGLVVPSEAVVDTGELQYVFVVHAGGRFEPRRVKIGSRDLGKVQLLEGAGDGETVVTTANFLVDSESRLRAAIEGISGGGAKATAGPEPGEWHSR